MKSTLNRTNAVYFHIKLFSNYIRVSVKADTKITKRENLAYFSFFKITNISTSEINLKMDNHLFTEGQTVGQQ